MAVSASNLFTDDPSCDGTNNNKCVLTADAFDTSSKKKAFGLENEFLMSAADSGVPANFLLKKDGVPDVTYELDPKALEWKKDENMCYGSNERAFTANPAIERCSQYSPYTCCNLVSDETINEDFNTVIP